jgi:hypothetical protein
MLTNKDRVRIHHFHAYNRVRLTLYTLPFKNPADPKETLYAVGMALCHKKDNGSRLEGRELAKISAELAQKEFPTISNFPRAWAQLIQPGEAIFASASQLKTLVRSLRSAENYATDCKALAIYNTVFRGNFDAPHIFPDHLGE